jgi:hypothetical protein
MDLPRVTLKHGERYGGLTVLGVFKRGGGRPDHYRVGCVCGFSKDHYSARKLMRGEVKKCSRRRKREVG